MSEESKKEVGCTWSAGKNCNQNRQDFKLSQSCFEQKISEDGLSCPDIHFESNRPIKKVMFSCEKDGITKKNIPVQTVFPGERVLSKEEKPVQEVLATCTEKQLFVYELCCCRTYSMSYPDIAELYTEYLEHPHRRTECETYIRRCVIKSVGLLEYPGRGKINTVEFCSITALEKQS